jgi:hypothetical protein
MYFYNKTKAFFKKLLSGGFGLPVTFWIFGALIAIVLGLLTKNIGGLWQLVVITLIIVTHLVLITIAVWNAAKAYTGARIWSWGAKLVAIAGVAKWLWFLPDLVVTFLGAFGIPVHSSDYWDMNPRTLTCTPALYQRTPESIQRRYEGCVYTESANGEVINLRCRASDINAEFFYTRNLADCNKYIEKLRTAKNK